MDKTEVLQWLKSINLFSTLNNEAYEDIALYFKPWELSPNEILFNQGDVPDYLYILVKGHLLAILQLANKDLSVMGEIDEGEVIGELGILSNQPRTMTIKSTINSILLKISAQDFADICKKYPAILASIIQPVISRSQKTLQILSKEKMRRQIAIIPGNRQISLKKFNENMIRNLSHFSDIAFISGDDYQLSKEEFKTKIKNLEEKNRTILYLLNEYRLPVKTTIDSFYIVTDEESNIDDSFISQIKKDSEWLKNAEEILVILKNNNKSLLHHRRFTYSHIIRTHEDKDYQRLLRFITGNPIGLVLGGGGLRSFVHLGVIKAIQEANIPIDMIGGTSGGSIAGACFAITEDYEKALNMFQIIMEALRHSLSWTHFTWPLVSLLNGKKGTETLMKLFRETKIEDLCIPYFCMTCNLNLKKEVCHRDGYIWEKIRGSSALPPLIPPLIIDNQIHVDGGLLNDLPVDVMRNFLGADSTIIAVSIFAEKENSQKYRFPPIITFWEGLKYKLKLGNKNYKIPSLMDMYLECLQLGSTAKELQSGKSADILIFPDLTRFNLLSLKKGQDQELINIGYEEMKQHLKNQNTKM